MDGSVVFALVAIDIFVKPNSPFLVQRIVTQQISTVVGIYFVRYCSDLSMIVNRTEIALPQ